MRNRVARAIVKIDSDGGINSLRQCSGLKERYGMLARLIPEMASWDAMAVNQLVFFLHHKHGMDFGVCPFYSMVGDHRQCCSFDSE
ncbi:MAG: hypothetical protein Q7S70_02800, partial [bacterium]|nr:hypothetical protein [bacterium]